ncbi:MAG: zinc-ribbon domain-containing protein [Bacillota bacterium]|nr:zinc-ribbon domain-containing protein [Bacillota bacterium]
MFCTNCGCENSDSSNFCKRCGTRLEPLDTEETLKTTEPETVEETQTAEETATETQETVQTAEETTAETAAYTTAETPTDGTSAAQETFQSTATKTQAETTESAGSQTQAETAQTPPAADTYIYTAGNDSAKSASLSGLRDMIRLGIVSPFKGLKAANKPENWLSGLLIFIVTDLILSLLITLAVSAVVNYVAGGYLNVAGLTMSMTGYSSGAVFLTALLLLLFSDVLEVFIIFGMGKAFGSKATLKSWLAVCATSQILFRLLSMVAVLLMMTGSGGMIVAMILISIGALSYLILMFKAFEIATELDNNKLFYGFICAYLVFIIAFSIVTAIISGINAANAYNNTYDTYNDFFNNNSF